MGLIWAPNLSTGVDWQDEQHKELFSHINEFLESLRTYQGRVLELERMLKFLDGYVLSHFGREEDSMDRLMYPERAAHKEEHLKFVHNINEIRLMLHSEKKASGVLLSAQRLLADWFSEHIGNVDKKLGLFLKERSA